MPTLIEKKVENGFAKKVERNIVLSGWVVTTPLHFSGSTCVFKVYPLSCPKV